MAPRRKKPRLSDDQINAATNSRSLFIRSLAPNTTTEDLISHFSQSYPIKHAVAVLDQSTKKCKGYGFVTFADAEDTTRAKEEFQGSELHERKIQLDIAAARHREPGDDTNGTKNDLAKAKAERDRDTIEQRKPPKLIVRNLPWDMKEEQLGHLFMSFGKIKDVKVPRKNNGLMCGFGFVLLRGKKNAQKAMDSINGKVVNGRSLAVDWAVDKDTWQAVTQEDSEKQEKDAGVKDSAAVEDRAMIDSDEGQDDDEDDDNGGVLLDSEEDENKDEGAQDEEYDEEDDEEESENLDGPEESDDIDEPIEEQEEKPQPQKRQTDNSATVFIRNLPFTCTDEDLSEHFSQFGDVRYARIVIDHGTERPKGTGFVCFRNPTTVDTCLREAPNPNKPTSTSASTSTSKSTGKTQAASKSTTHSVLQDEELDSTGRYTMDGRVLHVSRAVDRTEAARLTAEGIQHRGERDKDKRHLYLLSEGTIPSNSPLYEKLSPSERALREASAKQRRDMVEKNPSLHLSLTRLAVRNIPRSITSKDLKNLAREAVVGFATDVKSRKREALSKEERMRGGDEMKNAEHERKLKAKGIVKQTKVVFEGKEGGKVQESTGGGRSRGYGFIEYHTHRSALMGLRWLNGHLVQYNTKETKGSKGSKNQPSQDPTEEKKKRLIVEFAIENAQVVKRRNEREAKTHDRTHDKTHEKVNQPDENTSHTSHMNQQSKSLSSPHGSKKGTPAARKRKRSQGDVGDDADRSTGPGISGVRLGGGDKNSRIITQKRKARREKKKSKSNA